MGASLLAKAIFHSATMFTDTASSRASSLPQESALSVGSRYCAKTAIVAAIQIRGEHGLSTFCHADPGVFLQSDR
ncbi:hypothetical protein FGA82_31515 [Pseudomonas fluorescens]|nr:hypothetical protein FGA82_31515 [Pseudomonas fluorescens]